MSRSMRRALRALEGISDNLGPKRGVEFGPEQAQLRHSLVEAVFDMMKYKKKVNSEEKEITNEPAKETCPSVE